MFRLSTLFIVSVLLVTAAASISRTLRSFPAVDLGVAGHFAILSASGITDVYPSVVVGNVGTSPITGAALLLACDEVVGSVYTVDAAGPACRITSASYLTTAIADMSFAYNKAAEFRNPDFKELGAGSIGGLTLMPGIYRWTSPVLLNSDVTLQGTDSSFDKWVFQIESTLNVASAVKVLLSRGALAKNIIWQVAGAVTLETTSHFEGVILGKTGINMRTGATINGRLLAQTAVTLQENRVVQPQKQ